MGRPTFSDQAVTKVLIIAGGFERQRTIGNHTQLFCEYPTNDDDQRRVTVLLDDELRTGTLRGIADSAGARDFEECCE